MGGGSTAGPPLPHTLTRWLHSQQDPHYRTHAPGNGAQATGARLLVRLAALLTDAETLNGNNTLNTPLVPCAIQSDKLIMQVTAGGGEKNCEPN